MNLTSQQKRELLGQFTEQCLDAANELCLINDVQEFVPKFQLHFARPGSQGCYGGIKRDRGITPFIRMSTHPSYFSKDYVIEDLASHNWPTKGTWELARLAARRGEWLLVEYSHIHKDPEIGGFISNDYMDHMRAIVAHEMAHAIAEWNVRRVSYPTAKIKPHGKEWQAVYRALRVTWVNPHIDYFKQPLQIAANTKEGSKMASKKTAKEMKQAKKKTSKKKKAAPTQGKHDDNTKVMVIADKKFSKGSVCGQCYDIIKAGRYKTMTISTYVKKTTEAGIDRTKAMACLMKLAEKGQKLQTVKIG